MTVQKSIAKPFIELIFATTFWGFGFVATIWCLQHLTAPAIVFYRFFIAFSVGLLLIPFNPRWKAHLFHEFKLSIGGGILLGTTLVLQTSGLKYTTATKSAFITTLYVVIVPIIASLFLKQKLHRTHWLWVLIALAGTLLISELNFNQWSIGDTMTFMNAVTASIHIIYISRVAPRSQYHFVFNIFQSFWIMLIALLLLPFGGNWDLTGMPNLAWVGLLSMSLGSSLLGFFLQVKAQKEISPSVASILFLLESPLSFLFAFFLLGERLSLLQGLGAAAIIIACVGASLQSAKRFS